jgi:hypothetical protein
MAVTLSKYCGDGEDFPLKETCSKEAVIIYWTLAGITVCVLALCLYNAIRLIKNGKMKRVSLALFYLSSILSLICKYTPSIRSVAMQIFFLDVAFDYNLCTYYLFMGLVPYTYVCTAYAYIINIVQLILKDPKYKKGENRTIRVMIYSGFSILFIG